MGPVNATEVDTEFVLNWNTKVRFEWVKADGATEQRAEAIVTCQEANRRGGFTLGTPPATANVQTLLRRNALARETPNLPQNNSRINPAG